jgi:hypothetical protein
MRQAAAEKREAAKLAKAEEEQLNLERQEAARLRAEAEEAARNSFSGRIKRASNAVVLELQHANELYTKFKGPERKRLRCTYSFFKPCPI